MRLTACLNLSVFVSVCLNVCLPRAAVLRKNIMMIYDNDIMITMTSSGVFLFAPWVPCEPQWEPPGKLRKRNS